VKCTLHALPGDHAEAVLDRNDPNYDSDEEKGVKQIAVLKHQDRLKIQVQAYKHEVRPAVSQGVGISDAPKTRVVI